MRFSDVVRRMRFSIGNKKASAAGAVMMDSLESRSLLSATIGQIFLSDPKTLSAASLAATTAKLSVTSSPTTPLGISTTLAARVGSATGGAMPTGRVAFYDGSTVLASKIVNSLGVARLTANYLYVGAHNLKAVYLGSSTYLGHRSSVKTVTVQLPALNTNRDGLKVGTVTAGHGTRAVAGDFMEVNYTGYLSNGTKFESSLDTPQTFQFQLGVGDVIPGWDEGLVHARVGEKRVLVIPPALAYGAKGNPGIPPNATLIFVVDVVNILHL